jgi:hypothetical protein
MKMVGAGRGNHYFQKKAQDLSDTPNDENPSLGGDKTPYLSRGIQRDG